MNTFPNKGAFVFDSYAFDLHTGTLVLHYFYENGPNFKETLYFPPITRACTDNDRLALDRLAQLVFLLSGVSYAKAYVPEKMNATTFGIDPETAAFVEKVYSLGLMEFAHRNNLDITGRLKFADTHGTVPAPVSLELEQAYLVPVGGGKDSIVSIEAVRRTDHPVTLFALSSTNIPAAPIAQTIAVSGLNHVIVKRILSENLIHENTTGAFNGHIPITAILSACAVLTATILGISDTVLSNEHSASVPNFVLNGIDVNHQYSKSYEFENDFRTILAHTISPSISYFSLLRPLSELTILKRFSRLDEYHDAFKSCNAAFKQDPNKRLKNWCCNCPKCRFVFLGLAAFLPHKEMISIFGTDMLNDPAQTDGFSELCGLSGHKPFECVGTTGESACLLKYLSKKSEFKNSVVVQNLARRLPPDLPDISSFDAPSTQHFIPDNLVKIFL